MKEYFFKDLYINITATSTADGMDVQVQDDISNILQSY